VQIVDAHWEERNFGVTTQELIIEDSDDADSIAAGIDQLTARYQVLKLPSALIGYSRFVEDRGFSFIEAIIHIDTDKDEWGKSLPEYKILSESEIEYMLEFIATGIIQTDRFYLDPFFPKEKVKERYKNIVLDELGRGAVPLGILVDNEIIGFNILRKTGDLAYINTLDGVYPPYKGKKLSGLLLGGCIAYIEDNGGGRMYSGISSNNIASLRTHLKSGYRPNGVTYIYIKHI